MLITLSVGAVVLLLAVAITVVTSRAFRTANAQRDATVVAERALDFLVREIRTAQTGLDGGYPIRTAEDQELVILSDVDGDTEAEWVRYMLVNPDALEGGTLERSIVEASGSPPRYDPNAAVTTTVARGIRNGERPLFTYYNANYPKDAVGNPLPTPSRLSETRYVHLELDVNLDPKATSTTTVASGVAIRNLREGL
ncbi:MAG: hypothetical protein Q7S02_03045 [bacterium]|nr:hypothetical protein [bacterium]